MNIPGFTAEASLGRVKESHNLAWEGSAENGRVLPQFCFRPAGSNFVTCGECVDTNGDGVVDTCWTSIQRVAISPF